MYVALLRGVNVGGKNQLPMRDLAAMFVNAGCAQVRTYIQSGNVVFSAQERRRDKLPKLLAKTIEERFGFRTPVILRTRKQLGDAIQSNPFVTAGVDEKALHVFFLSDLPDAAGIGKLDPERSPPDAFRVVAREVFVHLPNGMARTKLTNAYFDTKLRVTSTARNWRTVLKLYEMTET